MESRYKKHLYTEVLGITNEMFCSSNSKIDGNKPLYNETSLYDEQVWPFIISGFHGTNLGIFRVKNSLLPICTEKQQ